MTGEIIEVCQDCGHVIDPVRVEHGGAVYEIRLCQRDECLFDRLQTAWLEELREQARRRDMMRFVRYTPIVNDPSAFRITGF